MDYQQVVDYWHKTAAHDIKVMRSLFRSHYYSDALFYGQLVLEKLLKAKVVETTKRQAPKIHDLVRLAQMANLSLTDPEIAFLDEMSEFNIEARYPDYRLRMYRLATKVFTWFRLKQVEKFYHTYGKTLSSKTKNQ